MIQMKRPVYASAAPTEPQNQHLIWIASYPKSGNTWVRVFLNNLLALKATPTAKASNINAIGKHTLWELRPEDYEKELGKAAKDATVLEIASVRAKVQARISRAQKAATVIKTHNAFGKVGGHPMINLDVTLAAIYVVRNPLDVVISYAHHSGIELDNVIKNMAREETISQPSKQNVFEFLSSWSFHVASWLSIHNRPILLLRYEDLLENPQHHFSRLASFLQISASEELINKAIEYSSFEELSRQEAKSGFSERPSTCKSFFRKGQRDQWREGLTREQFNAIIKAHAPMMMRMGYLPSISGAHLNKIEEGAGS